MKMYKPLRPGSTLPAMAYEARRAGQRVGRAEYLDCVHDELGRTDYALQCMIRNSIGDGLGDLFEDIAETFRPWISEPTLWYLTGEALAGHAEGWTFARVRDLEGTPL